MWQNFDCMEKSVRHRRQIIFYENYFIEFYNSLPEQVHRKIRYVFEVVCVMERIPVSFFRRITSVKGLYEIRIEADGNIYRVFCCQDGDSLVVLFNTFQKKTQKAPSNEIEKAKRLMNRYFNSKRIGE